jgi:hypothetical protein
MWHLVLEGDRLLRWLEASPLLEVADVREQLGHALLRVIRDKEAGPQVAQHFKDTVRVLYRTVLQSTPFVWDLLRGRRRHLLVQHMVESVVRCLALPCLFISPGHMVACHVSRLHLAGPP